jgi:hypothetical protein
MSGSSSPNAALAFADPNQDAAFIRPAAMPQVVKKLPVGSTSMREGDAMNNASAPGVARRIMR